MGSILKILAINHTEEQHFLSNILGFSFQYFSTFSTLQVEPTLMNVRGLVFKKYTFCQLSLSGFLSGKVGMEQALETV